MLFTAAVLLAVACLWQWTRGAERTAHIPPQTPRCDLAPALEGAPLRAGARGRGSSFCRNLYRRYGTHRRQEHTYLPKTAT